MLGDTVDLEDGGDVVAGVEFVDDVAGEMDCGVLDEDRVAVVVPGDAVEPFVDRAGELADE